jgi:cyclophilin family peptidyl-prolyl cis-trans isomerase
MKFLFWVALVCLVLIGCGGSSVATSTGSVRSVQILPASINLKPGESIQLTAVIDGDKVPIQWSVAPGSTGSITSTGVYTAGLVSGTDTIQLTLPSVPGKSATRTATVDSGISVTVFAPDGGTSEVLMAPSTNAQLRAEVRGATTQSVTWSSEQGTIGETGSLVVSGVVGDEFFVYAAATKDPTKRGKIKIRLVPPLEFLPIDETPMAISGSRITLKTKVLGVLSNNVTWSATGGTIDANGKWIAPSTVGTYTITATSKIDPTKSISQDVDVKANLNVVFKFTSKGDITLSLRPDKAPNHCANLVSLVNEKFYDGIVIHRLETGFVVQWGDPLTKSRPLTDPLIGSGGPGYTIDFETNDLKHLKYSLAMARSADRNSGGSQIYLCLNDQPSLDGNYVVFGETALGQSVVDSLVKGDSIISARVALP